MKIAHNHISFTSKIKIVSSKEFEEKLDLKSMVKNNEYVGHPWGTDQIILKKQAYTDKIVCCNAGGIKNSKEVMLFHLVPDISELNLNKIKQELPKKIMELKPDNHKLSGLIVGGEAYNFNSLTLFSTLKEIFSKFNVDLSIIWGQTQGGTRVSYSADKDTWMINSIKRVCPLIEDVKTFKDLKENFEFIHLTDNDTLHINGLHINNKMLKRLLKR